MVFLSGILNYCEYTRLTVALSPQHTSRYFVATSMHLVANFELSKHGGAHTTRGGVVEKKTEASFVRLDYATMDKETQKSKQTKSFRLLKSSKNTQLHCQHVLPLPEKHMQLPLTPPTH